jgi:3-dehydroquinate synthase family protein
VPTLTVALSERSYPIHIGEGLLARTAELAPVTRSGRAIIVTNPVVAALHLETLRDCLSRAGIGHPTVIVPDGESHKDRQTLSRIHTRLLELGAERSTLLFALGGGVIGDLAASRRRPISGACHWCNCRRRYSHRSTRRNVCAVVPEVRPLRDHAMPEGRGRARKDRSLRTNWEHAVA